MALAVLDLHLLHTGALAHHHLSFGRDLLHDPAQRLLPLHPLLQLAVLALSRGSDGRRLSRNDGRGEQLLRP